MHCASISLRVLLHLYIALYIFSRSEYLSKSLLYSINRCLVIFQLFFFSIRVIIYRTYNLPNCLVLDIGMVIENLHHLSKFHYPMHSWKHNYSYSIRIKVDNCSNTVEILSIVVENSSFRVANHLQLRIKVICHMLKLLLVQITLT